MKFSRLVNKLLLIAFVTLAVNLTVGASSAIASCGDYLEHSQAVEPENILSLGILAEELRLPWLFDKPCEGQGCKQSSPEKFSHPISVLAPRQTISMVAAFSTEIAPSSEREKIGWSDQDCDVDSAFCDGVFRPPTSFIE